MKRLFKVSLILLLAILLQSCVSSPTPSSSDDKPIESKPIESKPIESKPIESKPIESKPIEPNPIESNKPQDNRIAVFENDFVNPFQDWSWGSSNTIENGEVKVHITDAWGALRPHSDGEAIEGVSKVVFKARATQQSIGQKVKISFDQNGSFSDTTTIELTEAMQEYSVTHDGSEIVGVAWQDTTGNGVAPFYIDDIYLVKTTSTAASPPITTPSTNPVTPNNDTIQIFKDNFVSPFANWSWGSNNTIENGELKVDITEGWGALRPHTTGQAIENVTGVVFKARGNGQKVNISFDADGYFTEVQTIELTRDMKEFTIPHDRTPMVGIAWQDSTGSGLAPFFIDDIYLTTDSSPIVIKAPSGSAEVTLTVNPNKDIGAINPHIYGMSFANPELAKELDLPINRWGGNSTTRYNWEISANNRASDWFFLNVPDGSNEGVDETNLPATATFNSFIQNNLASNTDTLLTTPMIGWTTKDRNDDCGFDVNKYGPQDATEEPWRPNCGNGYKDGKALYGSSPTDTSKAIDEGYTQSWLDYINKRYGSDAVQYVALDNEPMLWNSTHRDVYPDPVGYDDMRDLAYKYAPAIKQVSPKAQIFGPVVWGWTAYEYSAKDIAAGGDFWNNPPDRNAHGGKPFLAWYLEQMATYEKTNGQRILDYLDIHFYPQQQNVALSEDVSRATQELRLRSTRNLWDSSYKDESWINEEVRLIPRMKELIATEYPGTKLALTEYNWGATKHINGALAQADALGIFGREGLDMAMFWANPDTNDAVSYAFRMFRNFDGQGGKFGETGVEAGSSQQDEVSIYAAKRKDGAVTIVIVNKSLKDTEVKLNGVNSSTTAEVFQYSGQNIKSIEKLGNQLLSNSFVLPKNSIRTLIIK